MSRPEVRAANGSGFVAPAFSDGMLRFAGAIGVAYNRIVQGIAAVRCAELPLANAFSAASAASAATKMDRGLLKADLAENLLSWKHSGFSIDNSVRIFDDQTRETLAEYMARPPRTHARAVSEANDQPLSLKKIRHEPFKSRVLFHTTYSEYLKQNVKMFDALDFIAELTQHMPPKGVQLIRRYGLYSSRIKGRWSEMAYVVERAPSGWKASREIAVDDSGDLGFEPLSASETVEVDADCRKQAWARLLAKIYEVDPFACPKCGSEMKVIAIVQETEEIRRILAHLVKIGRSPPGFDPISLN